MMNKLKERKFKTEITGNRFGNWGLDVMMTNSNQTIR